MEKVNKLKAVEWQSIKNDRIKVMGYDVKYRKRVVEYRLTGLTIKETSKIFKVSEYVVKSWVKNIRKRGN